MSASGQLFLFRKRMSPGLFRYPGLAEGSPPVTGRRIQSKPRAGSFKAWNCL